MTIYTAGATANLLGSVGSAMFGAAAEKVKQDEAATEQIQQPITAEEVANAWSRGLVLPFARPPQPPLVALS